MAVNSLSVASGRGNPDLITVAVSNCQKSKYDVILADPPWSFKTYSERGKGRSPERHYSIMSLEDICNLPVKDVAADNAVLFFVGYMARPIRLCSEGYRELGVRISNPGVYLG